MALSHDSFAFGSHPHTKVRALTSFDVPVRVSTFSGVGGELHTVDQRKGRLLGCQVYVEAASQALLETALAVLYAKAGTLTGTLTADGVSFVKCTFLGVEPLGVPFEDGTGVAGWVAPVQLLWRQRSLT